MFHLDLSCFNCGKDCDTSEDWLPYFNNSLCALCEAAMFEDMGKPQECPECGGQVPCASYVCSK